jgi:hypothetical protein
MSIGHARVGRGEVVAGIGAVRGRLRGTWRGVFV